MAKKAKKLIAQRPWTALRVITGLQRLFANPLHWTKGTDHKVRHTRKFGDIDCYCLRGGLNHIRNDGRGTDDMRRLAVEKARSAIIDEINRKNFCDSIVSYNDASGRSHRDIMNLLSRVKARLSA